MKKTYFVNKEPTLDSKLKTKPDSGGPMTDYTESSLDLLKVYPITQPRKSISEQKKSLSH